MKAIRIHKIGGPEVLQLDELPMPQAAPGEAVLRQSTIGINFFDIYFRAGLYKSEPYRWGLVWKRQAS